MRTAYIGTKYDGHDTAVFILLPHCEQAFGLSTERITRLKTQLRCFHSSR